MEVNGILASLTFPELPIFIEYVSEESLDDTRIHPYDRRILLWILPKVDGITDEVTY